ncbi:hypothetical protein MNAN1_001872 [Malassezia nana]|uniref:Mitotic checkpoint regulator, MAD2B-interacting-domain-containing protein n=1 Tax=Malassezia nana TaxID=180528 RepID=A0AAF0EM42_9BASI|nr:hypothetical protein MNAN1_001872 [Malassezia nana]
MSLPSLVAAYSSDSDSEDTSSTRVDVHKDENVPLTQSEASTSSSRMDLPAPKRANRAPVKRQIKVEAAPALAAEPPAPTPKRPRTTSSDTHTHSLLSMLPEPQHKEPIKKPGDVHQGPESLVDGDVRLVLHDTGSTKKKKGNDDFRAMLGLAPKPSKPATNKAPVIVEARPVSSPASEKKPPSTSQPASTLIHSLSAAPEVRERAPEPEPAPAPEPTSYPGWKQDADGGWYPVTPEAHAQYAAWAAQMQQEAEASMRTPGQTLAPMAEFDVAAEVQRVAPSRPASVSTPAPVRENLVSEKLRTDKFTNMRARTRGQLTSLLAMAHENRPMLEEKWAKGKSKMRENKKRYGF